MLTVHRICGAMPYLPRQIFKLLVRRVWVG
jgi:hypothetical protein